MKNVILAAIALAAVAGTASASGQSHSQLSNVDIAELHSLVPNADVDNLTASQVNSIRAALYGGDRGKVAALHAALR